MNEDEDIATFFLRFDEVVITIKGINEKFEEMTIVLLSL